ncbi:hypothetical protein HKBW3S06_00271 [Candidatus Hakubella thermalkaliphila]|uniref:Uncharacterized protein n=1 Tax=Candidatus Hakubella thermalkaliphila TaxID=2754717 RepID=A0A6V8NLE1_9ACTN|nr:hypothetical protein HKBW3S06_00271 [Candidatus Hakubella thermalkaliphila]
MGLCFAEILAGIPVKVTSCSGYVGKIGNQIPESVVSLIQNQW